MSKTTEIVVIEEAQPPQKPTPPNPFSFFSNFKLQLPFLPPPKRDEKASIPNPKPKRNLVSFPKTQVVVPPPLQAEPDDADSLANAKTSNPLILWQVYALGGIIISRWIWARWNERRARGRSPNDGRAEGRHSDDGRGSLNNE